jgi:hypothetical protein
MRYFLAALSLVAALSATAVTIAPGDLVVYAFDSNYGHFPSPQPHPPSYLLASDGSGKGTLPNPWRTAVFGPNGHLFVISLNHFPDWIEEYDDSLSLVGTIAPNFYPRLSMDALLIAPNGDFWVVNDTSYANPVLYVFTSDGQSKGTFVLPSIPLELVSPTYDLASDGCTLLYTELSHTGRRFNACTATVLPNLANGRDPFRPGTTDVVRALADGGYVAVHGPTLDFFDATDQLVRSIDTPFLHPRLGDGSASAITDLHFDSDSRFLWVAAGDAVYKIRIFDGSVVLKAGAPPVTFCVNGERRPTTAEVAASRKRIVPHASR